MMPTSSLRFFQRAALFGLVLAVATPARCQVPTPPPAVLAATANLPWTIPLEQIEALMRRESLDPGLLDGAAYAGLRAQLQQLLAGAPTRKQFVKGFNAAWRQGPSSHVRLQPAAAPAAQMAERIDQLDAGAQAVSLHWQGDVALLTVNTMMGRDTEAAIGAAYREISARPARGLVIDLRQNEGGAFAVKPLVGHLLNRPHDAGYFLSRQGLARGAPPARGEVEALPPWNHWSVRRFWADVQAQPFTRLRFEPMAPHYAGPVIVLSSGKTASAAELAVDALLGAGRARLIGERTAGQMLSQKPFDLAEGLLLFLPVADYHGWRAGRIEGRGIEPTRTVPAEQALSAALTELGP